LEDLWDRWAQHYRECGINPDRICRDGIAVPEHFAAAPQRVLFVLREVNDWEGGDLRTLLAAGPRYQTWHTVGRWAAGLLHGFPSYEEVDRWEVMRDALQSIASINLKKTSGGASADPAVVSAYAFQDRELLRDQIELISPHTIVACGTTDVLVWLLRLPVNADTPHAPVRTREGVRVIPWVHPARCDNRKTYQRLAELATMRQTCTPPAA
jgi:hypothetical protein